MRPLLSALAERADALGLRRLVAAIASIAYRRRFAVDGMGRWLNVQPEATIVSPVIHTTGFAAYRDWVLDHWAFDYRPQPGDVVIDVGAGVGEEAVVFSKLVGPSGHVFAIEAHPATFECLAETVRRSGLTNVTPLWLALSDAPGEARVAERANHLTSSIVIGGEGRAVPSHSLASLMTELGIERADLLKMNIEGAEAAAVRGMAGVERRVEHLVISCHDFLADRGESDQFRTREQVRAGLTALGYVLRTRPDHPLPWVSDYFYGRRSAE